MSRAAGPDDLEAACATLGVAFNDPALLAEALTHPSTSSARPSPRARPVTNQRLEFLGDRVLGLAVAERLYQVFPDETEGELARRYSALVDAPTLARVARDLDLGRFLALGPGEAASGGRNNPANLADACEALIGALYLDGGLEKALAFVDRLWAPLIAAQEGPPRDPKTALQEWTQARGLGLPAYHVVSRAGPAHDPTFEIEVVIDGEAPARASGGSKRAAEQIAAQSLLERLAGPSQGDG